jgi:hypothetical protein
VLECDANPVPIWNIERHSTKACKLTCNKSGKSPSSLSSSVSVFVFVVVKFVGVYVYFEKRLDGMKAAAKC